MSANIQGAGQSGSTALAALLRAATPRRLEQCIASEVAPSLLFCFLYPFVLAHHVPKSTGAGERLVVASLGPFHTSRVCLCLTVRFRPRLNVRRHKGSHIQCEFILTSLCALYAGAERLLGSFWQRFIESPAALPATVEALAACRLTGLNESQASQLTGGG